MSGLSRRDLLGAAPGVAAATVALLAAQAPGAHAAPVRRQAPAPQGAYRVDLHAHFLPPEYRAALLRNGYLTVGGYPTPEWSPELALDFMGRYGIAAQALAVSDPGVSFLQGAAAVDLARYCNDYAADLVRRHPTRFGSFAVLPMPDVVASVVEAVRALDVLGLDGVTLLSSYKGLYLGDPRLEPLMHVLNERGTYVFVHPAGVPDHDKPDLPLPNFLYEYPFDTTRAATFLMMTGVMARYPRIRFQLSHAGGTVPFLASRIGVAAETPVGQNWPAAVPRPAPLEIARFVRDFYYDTALSSAPAAMGAAATAGQKSRIVFGTDFPFSNLTLSGSGDPQPDLGMTFSTTERLQVERDNALAALPRLAARLR